MVLPRHSLSNFFGPFPVAPGAQDHHFRIPLLALRNVGFFTASPPLFTSAAKRWNLTSNVTPTLKWSGLYRGDQTVARTPYEPLSFTQPSTSPPPSPLHHQQLEPNIQRHPYTTTSMSPYAEMSSLSWPHTTHKVRSSYFCFL